jgi:uncharacterized membrane protein YdbT with pleckstrin-like domain
MSALASFVEKPVGIHFETQEKNETVLYLMRRHWVTNLGWLSLGTIMLLLPLVLVVSGDYLTKELGIEVSANYQIAAFLIWYLFSFGFLLENFLTWYFNVYIVTDKRLVDVDFFGLFYKQISECQLEKIQDVTHRMGGVAQIMFHYGDVLIQTAGVNDYFEFEVVPNPGFVQKKIIELIEKKQGSTSVSGVLFRKGGDHV